MEYNFGPAFLESVLKFAEVSNVPKDVSDFIFEPKEIKMIEGSVWCKSIACNFGAQQRKPC